jgi:hypothetical protein
LLIRDIPQATLARMLREEGIALDTGAFTTRVRIELPHVAEEFGRMYAEYPFVDTPGIEDFHVRVAAPSRLRRHFRPQAQTWVDGVDLMTPLPVDHGYPGFESSLNLAVGTSELIPLLVHSAVVERDGRALIMPAPSGSGKSTLCAALCCRGWRLMSDEMAVFCFEDGRLLPNPRPVSLKNMALDVIAAFEPGACMSRVYRGTNKGDVGYMRAPEESVRRAHEKSDPALVVAPTFRAGAPASLRAMPKTEGFRWLIDNSVNYSSMLRTGFDILTGVIERCSVYSMIYSNLDEAIDLIDRLHRGQPVSASTN